MLAALWARAHGWLLTAGAVLLVLMGAYAAGGKAARRSVEVDQARSNARAREKAREVDDKYDQMADDSVRDSARQWVRKP